VESQRGVAPDALARRIVEAIGEPVALDEATVTVGCCIGIAVFPRHAHDAGTLVSRADAALYSLKKAGVGGFRVSPGTELA
jgi:predicted signal transduction protein with EAL and GGDEF domain